MTKYLLSTTCLMLLLFWPIQAQEPITTADNHNGTVQSVVPTRFTTISETNYKNTLALRGYKLDTQGLLIESLDASTVYADLNSDVGFNPASVIKIATSFAALTRFGPEYHFETSFLSDGVVNKKTRTLNGDLILYATGDPVLQTADVLRLARQVVKAGIVQVNGNLVVSGPFSYGILYTTDRAVRGLSATLRKVGVRVKGTTKVGDARGDKLATHISSSLRDILFFQNAHSHNPTAERLGEAIGGPKAVEQFLVNELGVPQGEIYLSHTSGLDYNRITPRATVKLFRELVFWLNQYGLQPQDVMPVAGIDPGTLHSRFTAAEYRGAIVGKTGTLPGTDGGVSTLAGILYTRDRGVLLFAIFNTKGPVRTYRRLQDGLLKDVLMECGGVPEVSASLHKLNN
jgi:D-alanyl-D-alanine carboxypeptidase